jgi:hypothetical protein
VRLVDETLALIVMLLQTPISSPCVIGTTGTSYVAPNATGGIRKPIGLLRM